MIQVVVLNKNQINRRVQRATPSSLLSRTNQRTFRQRRPSNQGGAAAISFLQVEVRRFEASKRQVRSIGVPKRPHLGCRRRASPCPGATATWTPAGWQGGWHAVRVTQAWRRRVADVEASTSPHKAKQRASSDPLAVVHEYSIYPVFCVDATYDRQAARPSVGESVGPSLYSS